MDNRSFISRLAKAAGLDVKTTSALATDTAALIAEAGANLDNVAIPGFGSFESVKTNEQITTNPSTGQRCLMPPHITMTFKSGSRLKKAVKTR